jgi:amidase
VSFAEYDDHDGLGLAERVAKGEVTPAELVEEAIGRVELHQPQLNAVVHTLYDRAREDARNPRPAVAGPFQGVPFLLKDLLGDIAGVPTTSGSRFLRGIPAPVDAELVRRYRRAGVIPIGKTNTPEFGLLPTTEPVAYGPTRNPWNPGHSAGGSSGGSAAAVAAGIVPLAHANDGGGSIRIPASCCGLVGMKPSRARNPLGPRLGDIMGGLVCEHVVSRTVRDSAAMLDCTAGPDMGDPYCAPPPDRSFLEETRRAPGALRIAFSTDALDGTGSHPECAEAVARTAALLEELGHEVEEASPAIPGQALTDAFMAVWTSGATATIDGLAAATGRPASADQFEALTWAFYEQGRKVSAARYMGAQAVFQHAARRAGAFHEHYDVWMTPTLAQPPIELGRIDASSPEPDMEALSSYVPFTPLQNATGQPGISLPLHWSAAGLPVGVHFSARLGGEGVLYSLASQLEEARPWRDRRPPIWGGA